MELETPMGASSATKRPIGFIGVANQQDSIEFLRDDCSRGELCYGHLDRDEAKLSESAKDDVRSFSSEKGKSSAFTMNRLPLVARSDQTEALARGLEETPNAEHPTPNQNGTVKH